MKRTLIPIRFVLVIFTFLHTLNLLIDRAVISAAKDSIIIADLNLTLNQWGWIMASFTIGYALFQTPSGYFADSKGLRFVLTFIVFFSSCLTTATRNWFSGWRVDKLYKPENIIRSRRIPAIVGFILVAFGILMMMFFDSPKITIVFLSIAIFGADMTLSPSWSFCIDIAKEHTGAVSGTMNIAGNLGAFVTIIAFPYLLNRTGSHSVFFYLCAILSILAIVAWWYMRSDKAITNNN